MVRLTVFEFGKGVQLFRHQRVQRGFEHLA
jgi:hypothetical protein